MFALHARGSLPLLQCGSVGLPAGLDRCQQAFQDLLQSKLMCISLGSPAMFPTLVELAAHRRLMLRQRRLFGLRPASSLRHSMLCILPG